MGREEGRRRAGRVGREEGRRRAGRVGEGGEGQKERMRAGRV